MENIDRLLTNESAAEMLGISCRVLVRLRDEGQIPYVKLADSRKGYRYSALALSAWIAERQQRNKCPSPAKGGAN